MHTLAQADRAVIEAALFYPFAGLTCLCALMVLFSRQIVRMALWLLGTLIAVAALYFLIEAELIAAVQLIVYAGGTLILIIFGIMLTTTDPFARMDVSKGELATGIALGFVTLGLLGLTVANWTGPTGTTNAVLAVEDYPVSTFGKVLLSKYLIAFETAGVLLLIVMIAAAYMAKGRRREQGPDAAQ